MNGQIPFELAEQIARGNSILWWGWDASPGPTTTEIVQALAAECNYLSGAPLNLPAVASYYQDETDRGRQALIRRLMELLEGNSPDSDLVQAAHLPFNAIITPRYDGVVEQAVREAGRRLVVIVEDQDVPFWDRDKTLVLKMYGSLERPGSLTITQDDYYDYALRRPLVSKLLHILLAINHMVLCRPWLGDVNFQRIYQEVRFHTGRFQRMRYALVDDFAMSNYWRKQGLVCITSGEGVALRNLLAAVEQIAVPISPRTVVRLGRRPYKFLDYYTSDDKDLFFGRDRQIREAGELILSHRLVVLYGQSGVGKTSLVLAGLVPVSEEYGVQPIYVRCGSDPEAAIKREALALWPQDLAPPTLEVPLTDLLAQLSREIDRPLTVFIDQFEEFALLVGEAKQRAFASALGDWWSYEPAPAQIVISLREDYLGILDRFAPHLPNPLQITFRLHNFDPDEAKLAIGQPAEKVGLSYEPELVDQILKELLQASGKVDIMPPQLQIVCNRLYDELRRENDTFQNTVLTWGLYRQLGGAEHILADYADYVLDRFAAAKREKAEAVLKALVSSKGEKRPLSADQIAADTDLTIDATRGLLRDLDQHRLIRRVESVDGVQFEVIHDYLASRIASWIGDEERKLKEIQDLLRREASDRESYGSVLSLAKYKAAYELRNSLVLDKAILELLLASALYHSYDPDFWFDTYITRYGGSKAKHILNELIEIDDATLQSNLTGFLTKLRTSRLDLKILPLERIDWLSPSFDLLPARPTVSSLNERQMRETITRVEKTLRSRGVSAQVAEVNRGPTVTQYGLELSRATIKKFLSQESELQLALGVQSIRLLKQIPGKSLVGIEVPNREAMTIGLRDVLEECPRRRSKILPVALGMSASGMGPVCEDLFELTHLLMTGEFSSGKTMLIKALIGSLLFMPPNKVRFLLISSQPREFAALNRTPHLVLPVVQEPRQVVRSLQWVQSQIQRRQNVLARLGIRTLNEYHQRASTQTLDDLSHCVIVIDDYENAIITSKSEVHDILDQVTMIGRHVGLHLIVSTRRPLASVLPTGVKANFPSQVAFRQPRRDSKLIFGEMFPEVEKLLGRGDMLLRTPSRRSPDRLQGCFVSEEEIELLVEHWSRQLISGGAETYLSKERTENEVMSLKELDPVGEKIRLKSELKGEVLLDDAIAIAKEAGRVSPSLLQRRLRIGYSRAARLIDLMEQMGVVGPPKNGQRTRAAIEAETASKVDDDSLLKRAMGIIQAKENVSISMLRHQLGLSSGEAVRLLRKLKQEGLI